MVTSSGFTSAPVTRTLIFGLISSSIFVSALSIKHYLPIKPIPHLWPYLQLWRLATYQLSYTSSTELLFSCAILYQLRVLERLWGSRKLASFVAVNYAVCGALTVALGLALKLVTGGRWEMISAGPTALVVALLAAWRHEIPRLGGFKLLLSERPVRTIDFSDKWTMYVLAVQLGLSQFPFNLSAAVVGWVVGNAWVEEALPVGFVRWRLPGWVVGEVGKGRKDGQLEGLRRRMAAEGGVTEGMRSETL